MRARGRARRPAGESNDADDAAKLSRSEGKWVTGASTVGEMYLAYYDQQDRKGESGFGGWKKNRQCIGYWNKSLPKLYEKRGEGEYIRFPGAWDHPTFSGVRQLCLTILSGYHCFDTDRKGEAARPLRERIVWLLYGETKMEVVDNQGYSIDTDDMVYTATAIDGAASDVDIDLKAGGPIDCPTSRALILHGDSQKPYPRFRRNGHWGLLHELLLNTLVTQYDTPRIMLTGEARIDLANPLIAYTDAAQPADRRFILTAASMDCRAGTADCTFREIAPDSYTPVETE